MTAPNKSAALDFSVEQDTQSQKAIIEDIAGNSHKVQTRRLLRRFYAKGGPGVVAPVVHGTVGSHSLPNRDNVLKQSTTSHAVELLRAHAPVIRSKASASVGVASYRALQEWEGYVTSIGSDSITADLIDLTNRSTSVSESVELPTDELSDEQIENMRVGSVFRWTIGYETLPSGQRRRVSQLVFRQLPRWTRAEIDAARAESNNRNSRIQWE